MNTDGATRNGIVAVIAPGDDFSTTLALAKALPTKCPIAWLIGQQVDARGWPRFESSIAACSRLPVVRAHPGMRPTPGHVHLLPPGHDAAFEKGGVLVLNRTRDRADPAPSVDALLESVDANPDIDAIAFVLIAGSTRFTAARIREIVQVARDWIGCAESGPDDHQRIQLNRLPERARSRPEAPKRFVQAALQEQQFVGDPKGLRDARGLIIDSAGPLLSGSLPAGAGGPQAQGTAVQLRDHPELRNHAEVREQLESARLDEARASSIMRGVHDAVPSGLALLDEDGVIVMTNRAWRTVVAARPETAKLLSVGRNLLDSAAHIRMNAHEGPDTFLDRMQELLNGATAEVRHEYATRFHTFPRHLRLIARPFQFMDNGRMRRHFVILADDVTNSRTRRQKLQVQQDALDAALVGVMIADASVPETPITYVNRGYEEMSGYRAEDMLGTSMLELLSRSEGGDSLARLLPQGLGEQQPLSLSLRSQKRDGTAYWSHVRIARMTDAQGHEPQLVGVFQDISKDLVAAAELQESNERGRFAMEFAGVGSFSLNLRTSDVEISVELGRLLDLTPETRTLDLDDFRNLIHADDRESFDAQVLQCLAGHAAFELDFRLSRNEEQWLHTRGRAAVDLRGHAYKILALAQDVSERRRNEAQARHVADHDSLTGLVNRNLLKQRLEDSIERARETSSRTALLFIDLDKFKDVNDRWGHEAGDAVLVGVASRLRNCLRAGTTICRHSGDEFVVILDDVHARRDCALVCERILLALSEPFELTTATSQQASASLACSIGVAIHPDDGRSLDTLLRHADLAMYHAKSNGGRGARFFSHSMSDAHQARVATRASLRGAAARGELLLHFQPEFCIDDGRAVAVEALVRWQHPERGMLYPDAFLPAVEDTDLIDELGSWVLLEACRRAASWQDGPMRGVSVAVNISPNQLRDHKLIEQVNHALDLAHLDPGLLELELTERALVDDPDHVAGVLNSLRHQGVRMTLDDFGTGFSSLSWLLKFPIDKLKIDRSFIQSAPSNQNAAAIVRAIVTLSESLGLEIIAEGVETPDQLSMIRAEGLRLMQGFLASESCAFERLESRIAEASELLMRNAAVHQGSSPAPAGSRPRRREQDADQQQPPRPRP